MIINYKCAICENNKYEELISSIQDWEYGFEGKFSYYQCRQCNLIQIYPLPTMEDIIKAYDVDYHGYTYPAEKGIIYKQLYQIVDWFYINRLKKKLNQNSKVLDIGCGIGLFLSKLKSIGLKHLDGIDFSDKAIKTVNIGGMNGFLGTFLEFDQKSKYYDMILMNNYLEHTLNPLEELKKAHSLLKDSGILLGELPNFDSLDRFLFGRFWGGNHVPRHIFQFDKDKLFFLLKKAGFKDVKITFPLNTSHFALSIQNYMQRNVINLRNNKNLKHGRSMYYSVFMLVLIPLNLMCMFFNKTGSMKFCARI